MKYQLCFDDGDMEPVKWIDHPDLKIPLFASIDEAENYLSETHSIYDMALYGYKLAPVGVDNRLKIS